MKKNKVENIILLVLMIRSLFLLFFNKLTITDLIIGGIIGLILIFIYQKLNLKKYNIFKLMFLFLLVFISFIILKNITYFIQYNILKNFSLIMIAIPFLLISFYMVYKGYHAYIKTVELSSYILVLMFSLSFILLIPYLNSNNFIPFNYQPSLNSIKLAFFILIIFMAINYLNNYQLNYKVYALSIGNIIILRLLITGILSQTLENVFKYPYISIFKKISYFDFLERLEGLLAIQFLFDYLFLLTLFLLTIKFLIFHLFKVKERKKQLNSSKKIKIK